MSVQEKLYKSKRKSQNAGFQKIYSPKTSFIRKNNIRKRNHPQNEQIYPIEGAFGVVKYDYGFQRFLHRVKKKVFAETLIVAIGYNINKYHNKLQQNRTDLQLHEKLIS